MKIKATFFAILISLVTFSNVSAINAQTASNQSLHKCASEGGQITEREIIEYISDVYGETVISISDGNQAGEFRVLTKEGHQFIVYVVDGIIVDSVELPIG